MSTKPVQGGGVYGHGQGAVSEAVYMRAYEVYCALYGPQEALVTGHCRGGLSKGELIAFLYIRSFPRDEWRAREREAFEDMSV